MSRRLLQRKDQPLVKYSRGLTAWWAAGDATEAQTAAHTALKRGGPPCETSLSGVFGCGVCTVHREGITSQAGQRVLSQEQFSREGTSCELCIASIRQQEDVFAGPVKRPGQGVRAASITATNSCNWKSPSAFIK